MTFKTTGAVLVALALYGCADGGIGRKGSPAWEMTADPSAKRQYYVEQCVMKGIKLNTPEMDICINSKPSGRTRLKCMQFGGIMSCK